MEYANNTSSITLVDLMPINARKIFEFNEDIVFFVSMTFNFLLIIVLLTEKNKFLKAYTRVLLQNCLCDVVYTIVMFATKIECEYYDGRLVILSAGFYSHMSLGWHYFFFFLYVFFVLLSMLIIPIVVYFRYCLVVKNKHLSERFLLAMLGFVAGWCFIMTTVMIISMISYSKDREKSCRQVFTHPMWTYGGRDISNCLTTDTGNPMLLMYYGLIAVSNVTMYTTMIYCTRAVFKTLGEAKATLREKTAKLQRQMNMLLIIQLIIPIVCGALPLTLACASCVLRLTLPGLGMLVLFCFAWIPLINPFITILLVSNYRRKCAKIFLTPIAYVYSRFRKTSTAVIFPSTTENSQSTNTMIA